jgi:hypothetical protein
VFNHWVTILLTIAAVGGAIVTISMGSRTNTLVASAQKEGA